MKISTVQQSAGMNGYVVTDTNGIVSSVPNDENNTDYRAVQDWINDGGTVDDFYTLSEAKDLKIAEAKAEAHKRIVAIIPEWKQRNYTARAVQLLRAQDAAPLTVPEITELDAIENIFTNQVKPIRDASDVIEAEINAKLAVHTTLAIDIENHVEWP